MDGLQNEAKQVDEGAAQEPQGAPAQVSGDDGAAGSVEKVGVTAASKRERRPSSRT
jgi:hypothetical protein